MIDCPAEQLARPIRFADAVTQLARAGITTLVECGPLRGLAAMLDCDAMSDTQYCRASASADVLRSENALRVHAREVA